MVKNADFLDQVIVELSIKYDWYGSLHYAQIVIADKNGIEKIFRINGLLEYCVYDDFGCMHITQVKLLQTEEQIYLSLDPYDELSNAPDYEKDYFWFKGSEIVQLTMRSN